MIDFNKAVAESIKSSPSPTTGRLQFAGENEKVKFLSKLKLTGWMDMTRR